MELRISEKVAKLPTFDGTKSKFAMWWRRFLAYAKVNKFSKALIVGGNPNLPATDGVTIDATTETGKLEVIAKSRNNLVAVASFTMAFETEEVMAYINPRTTVDWPDGLASEIVKSLLNEYMPEDLMSKIEMRRELNKTKMKKTANPNSLFVQLVAIEIQFRVKLDLLDLMAIVLDVCPEEECKPVITAECRAKGAAFTIENIKEAMTEHYRTLKYSNGDGADNDDKFGLAVTDAIQL